MNNSSLISPCKSSIRDFKSQKGKIISPYIEICRKGTDFEEFEKKWINDSNNNNNKQTFRTASAYQLVVKKTSTLLHKYAINSHLRAFSSR